jgi:hypothetical protein
VLTALTKTAQVASLRLTWIQTFGPEPLYEYDSLRGVVDLTSGRLEFTSLAELADVRERLRLALLHSSSHQRGSVA